MRTVALFLLFVASSSAFTVAPPLAVAGTKQNGRFSSLWAETDSNSAAKPLEEIDIAQPTNLQAAVSSEGSVVKDMNTGEIKEVKWVDPAMTANTKFEMDWWAYPLFGFPFVLILNDFLHFLPSDGPLSFLTQL